MRNFDAIIIGAGPAGSSAAILLAAAGWSVAIVEKQAFPRRKVCGECMAATNLALLDALGIGAAFAAEAGAPLTQLEVMGRGRRIRAPLPPAADAAHPYGRALGRERLDTLLLERATTLAVQVWQPWALHSVDGGPGAYRCTITSVEDKRQETLAAPIVISAHGSWEPLPSERQARRAQRRVSDLFAFKANYRDAALAADTLVVLSFAGGYGGMVLADDGVTTLACCVREDHVTALRRAQPGKSAGEVVEEYLRRECPGVDEALRSARREGAWLATGPIAPGVHVPADGGDVFMIGNAAGEAHPIVGEGMSMALQSAWLLCDTLVQDPDVRRPDARGVRAQRQARARYARHWRRQFAPRIRLAAWFAHSAMHPWMAALAGPVLSLWPGALVLGARLAGKTRCAVDAGTLARLKPGGAATAVGRA